MKQKTKQSQIAFQLPAADKQRLEDYLGQIDMSISVWARGRVREFLEETLGADHGETSSVSRTTRNKDFAPRTKRGV